MYLTAQLEPNNPNLGPRRPGPLLQHFSFASSRLFLRRGVFPATNSSSAVSLTLGAGSPQRFFSRVADRGLPDHQTAGDDPSLVRVVSVRLLALLLLRRRVCTGGSPSQP